ncbi:AEC family transporter [Roseibacterium sp. SDUM158016]|jgi:predicted permease|uniref:AEC family transporter n=1 Tax=Roseicyclus sediminis TaxID=2980997 RepID=UPI0021CF46A4|nr:AEC family transporter [Roseibacterium sp. SDUM158016]MCU4654021.1 AEC family transporter [Roseibacterium sp. SDUM158016]
MLATALAIAPVFLLICAGYALRRGGIPSEEFWTLNDRLVYFVLMPALFFVRISEADLSGPGLMSFAAVLYAGFFAAVLFGVAAAVWLARGGAVGTSVIQGAGRFNTFVALAVAEALHGAEGLQLAVLGAALLVPVVNLTVVGLFAVFLPRPGVNALRGAAISLVTNPLILSILAAIGFNAAGLAPVPVVSETLSILGQAALPIMLLCVGASLKLRGLSADALPVALSAAGKLLVFPLAILAVSALLGLDPLPASVALIYGALPTGVAAYTLSRQLGGDAPLMATMITIQTLLAFAVMPVWLSLAG